MVIFGSLHCWFCNGRYEHTMHDAIACAVSHNWLYHPGVDTKQEFHKTIENPRVRLFQRRDFITHSGLPSDFKIDCDALSIEDWETLAFLVRKKFTFSHVIGVPTGGIPFAEALEPFCVPDSPNLLLVDDVFTTGASLEQVRTACLCDWTDRKILGVVVFARNPTPEWIYPIFQMWG